jgi:UDP-N-acetyl-2-amino-2-deoxyglucuronate dehydrogenase
LLTKKNTDKTNNPMKNFALIGTAGYIAPRHLKAIKETGNNLLAALDPFDSVGIMDSYFPDAAFFTEPERFDRHMDKLRRSGNGHIEYASICSPNYLHDSHIRMALRNGAHAICEKPIVLNPWNVDALQEIEKECGHNIYTILQLRHHPAIIALKEKVSKELAAQQINKSTNQLLNKSTNQPLNKSYDIDLTYITSRGAWYHRSWKGDIEKSGGVATNIGVHFFDMLTWIFGPATENIVHVREADHAAGFLQLENARVRWFLSINRDHLPEQAKAAKKATFRSITVNGEEVEFSDGFGDLHTVSYKNILEGKGYGLEHARPSIEIVQAIRNKKTVGKTGDYHPFV